MENSDNIGVRAGTTGGVAYGGVRGSALLLVLWIIGILGLLTLSFAFDAHLEGKILLFSRKKLKCESLAESGMEIARMLLDKRHGVTGEESEDIKAEDRWYVAASQLRNGRSITIEEQLGDGKVRLDIEPEEVWRNINRLTEEDWERILQGIGVPEEMWPEMIDSYFDWLDEDDEARQNGAETEDYYATLDPPYSAANAPFGSVRELLLVKGFSEPVLSGGILNPDAPKESHLFITNGVERLFTVYGDGKVNVNAIRRDNINVLMTLPGVTEIGANAILEEREQGASADASSDDDSSYKSVADFMSRVGDLLDDEAVRDHITTQSSYFRITSVGQIDRVTHRVCAVVFDDGKIWRVLRWREEP